MNRIDPTGLRYSMSSEETSYETTYVDEELIQGKININTSSGSGSSGGNNNSNNTGESSFDYPDIYQITEDLSFCMPIANYDGNVSYPFGSTTGPVNPLTGKAEPHNGIDISVPVGTPVFASSAGSITHADDSYLGGLWIEIKHNARLSSQR